MSGMPELGSRISLISKADIRYEGSLFTVDPKDCTIALSSVRSYGTEDRETSFPVPAQSQIYDYILFRGSDIKDIRVLTTTIPNDPAIVQLSVPPSINGMQYQASGSGHQSSGYHSSNSAAMAAYNMYQTAALSAQQASEFLSGVPDLGVYGFTSDAYPFSDYSGNADGTTLLLPNATAPGNVNRQLDRSPDLVIDHSPIDQLETDKPLDNEGNSRNAVNFREHSQQQTQIQQRQPREQQQPTQELRKQKYQQHQPHQRPQQHSSSEYRMPYYQHPQHKRFPVSASQSSNNVRKGGHRPQTQQQPRYRSYERDEQERDRGERGANSSYFGYHQRFQRNNSGWINNNRFGRSSQSDGITPTGSQQKQKLRFDNDYDFEEANIQFEELMSKLSKSKIDDEKKDDELEEKNETDVDCDIENCLKDKDQKVYYDKSKSFFDNISCEAVERSSGRTQRTDWKTERKLNSETFGVASSRRPTGVFRGRGGYYYGSARGTPSSSSNGYRGYHGGYRQYGPPSFSQSNQSEKN